MQPHNPAPGAHQALEGLSPSELLAWAAHKVSTVILLLLAVTWRACCAPAALTAAAPSAAATLAEAELSLEEACLALLRLREPSPSQAHLVTMLQVGVYALRGLRTSAERGSTGWSHDAMALSGLLRPYALALQGHAWTLSEPEASRPPRAELVREPDACPGCGVTDFPHLEGCGHEARLAAEAVQATRARKEDAARAACVAVLDQVRLLGWTVEAWSPTEGWRARRERLGVVTVATEQELLGAVQEREAVAERMRAVAAEHDGWESGTYVHGSWWATRDGLVGAVAARGPERLEELLKGIEWTARALVDAGYDLIQVGDPWRARHRAEGFTVERPSLEALLADCSGNLSRACLQGRHRPAPDNPRRCVDCNAWPLAEVANG